MPLKKELNNSVIMSVLERAEQQLPPLPVIVAKLMEVINAPDSSADDAAGLLAKDPVLTGKILRLANSAFYGRPRSVSSVSSAVVILGFNTIRTIIFGSTLIKLMPGSSAFSPWQRERFWHHSILCGLIAKSITQKRLAQSLIDPETAFCAGIMHDIGKLIFAEYFSRDYMHVCRIVQDNAMTMEETERSVFGVSHAGVGRIIADRWALPRALEDAVVLHHTIGDEGPLPSEFVCAVHVADRLAHDMGFSLFPKQHPPTLSVRAREALGLDDAGYTALSQGLDGEVERARAFLDVIR